MHYRGGVILTAGIARGHRGVWILLEENGFELGQRLDRGVGARMFIGIDHRPHPYEK